MREKRAGQEGRRGNRGGGGAEAGAGGGGTEPNNISCIYRCTITWLHDSLLYFYLFMFSAELTVKKQVPD